MSRQSYSITRRSDRFKKNDTPVKWVNRVITEIEKLKAWRDKYDTI